MDNWPPNSSPSTTSTAVKSDTHIPTTTKPIQLSVKDLMQCNVKPVKRDNMYNRLFKPVKRDNMYNRLFIYHQNIRGLKGKISEFPLTLLAEAPHLICFTEHHLKEYELTNTHIPKYKLGASYCRKNLKQGGVCIYVCESIKFSYINSLKHNKEQDIEIAAVQLNFQKKGLLLFVFIELHVATSNSL